jgi:xylulokinase
MRGGWLGIEWQHTCGHLYRAILESIAFEYSLYLQKTVELYPEMIFELIYSIGGGAKSRLWSQIKADVLGLPVRILLGASNLAARGSAMLAAQAIGYGEKFKPARLVQRSLEFLPDSSNHQKYQEFAPKYHEIIDQLDQLYSE